MSIRFLCAASYGILFTTALASLLFPPENAVGNVPSILALAVSLCCALAAAKAYSLRLRRVADCATNASADFSQHLAALAPEEELASIARAVLSLREALHKREERAFAAEARYQTSRSDADAASDEAERQRTDLQTLLKHMERATQKAGRLSHGLGSDVRKLAQLVADVDGGVETQHFRLRDTGEAMRVISQSVAAVAANAAAAWESSQASREKAEVGTDEVRNAVCAIETVRDTMLELKQTMGSLEQKATAIGAVMSVINEVADQTNLLALNAAIEAARAGEAGRGFAVVADEVRKLAEKTMHATGEVESAVLSIRQETQRTMDAVDLAARHSMESAERASAAGRFMDEIMERMRATAEQLSGIASAAAEQSESSGRTNLALEDIQNVASATARHMLTFTEALTSFSGSIENLDIILYGLQTGKPDEEVALLIQWGPQMEVGFPLVDAQHRTLCSYINALHRATRQGQERESLKSLLSALKDYTQTHFSTEEQYFGHSAYPDVEKHKKIHCAFMAKIIEFETGLHKGTTVVSNDLLTFLKDWLVNHIQGTDKEYVPYLRQATSK